MKKLLVLNGSHSDIPLILAGKKLGYYVITSGNRPDLIGHKYADEYVQGDFSQPEEMLDIFKDKGLDAICSCCNDFGIITSAYLAEMLQLPGHDTYENSLLLHHKDQFKAFSAKYHIHTPLAKAYDDVATALSNVGALTFPVIVKPIDLTGGKGVSKVEDEQTYKVAVLGALNRSPSHRIVVEPFIDGTQHSFSTFLVGGKVRAYYSDNEYSYLNPYLVSTSGGPATHVGDAKDILIADAEKIANLLALRDGVFHYQYIMHGETPYILEITRRCSGDLYNIPVEKSTGIPWAEWIVRAECGMPCDDFPFNKSQKSFGGRHCIMGHKNGIVKDVRISPVIQSNIYRSFLWWKPGMEIRDYLTEKLGILFMEYDSEEDMLEKIQHIADYIQVIYYE